MAIALDGTPVHARGSFGGNPGGNTVIMPAFSTTQAGDVLFLICSNIGGATVTGVSGSTLGAWTYLGGTQTGSPRLGEVWACFAPSALTSEIVTVTMGQNWDPAFTLFALSGSNQTSLTGVFETAVTNQLGTFNNSVPINYTTTHADTAIIASTTSGFGDNPGSGSGFTAVMTATDGLLGQYKVNSATGTYVVTASITGTVASVYAIALIQATAGPPTGTLAATEARDIAAFTGGAPGVLAAIETQDTAAITGQNVVAWVRVQGASSTESSTATLTKSVSFGATVAVGGTVCGICSYDLTGGATVVSVIDDKGNSYNVESVADDSPNGNRSAAFSRSNITNGPITITVTLSASKGYFGVLVDEFSGGSTSSSDARDGSAHGGNYQGTVSNAANAITTSSYTTTTNGDLIYGATVNTGGTFVPNAGTGFSSGSGTSWPDYSARSEYKTQNAAAAGTVATFTGSGGTAVSTNWLIAVKPFVAASGTSGTLGATEAKDTAAITGQLGVIGTLAATEAADIAVINGGIVGTGTLNATEAADTAVINGGIFGSGTLNVTEAKDTAVINGGIVGTGTLAVTEAKDTAVINGGIVGSGTLAVTEGLDTALLTGTVTTAGTIAGSLNATEAADTALINGSVTGVVGTLATTEAPDTALISGTAAWNAALASTEAKDTAAFSGTAAWNAVLAAIEAGDIAVFAGTVTTPTVTGTLAATEARDAAAITGNIVLLGLTGILAATEGRDTALIIGGTPTTSPNEVPGAPGVLTFGRRVTINRW